MTTRTAGWIGDQAAHDAELFRLRALERVFDDRTRRLLTDAGVRPGARCLEVGAGAGSVTRWLAEQVGPTGSVVAVDMNCRYLTDLPDNVEVREVDASATDFGTAEFDVVHHRLVLAYVPQREQVLQRLAVSVRPGGWLVSEEGLWMEEVLAGDTGEALMRRFFAALKPLLEAAGTDTWFAATLPSRLREIGLTEVGHDGSCRVAQGGAVEADAYWPLLPVLGPRLVRDHAFTEDEVQVLSRLLRDPASRWTTITVLSAWGRRP